MVNVPSNKDPVARRAAFEKLNQAIKEHLEFEGWTHAPFDGSPMMPGDYMVIVSQQGWDKEGDGISSIACILGPDGHMPWYRILGLLETAKLRQHMNYMGIEDNDDNSNDGG